MRKLLWIGAAALALLFPARASATLSVVQSASGISLPRDAGVPSASITNVFGSNITAGSTIGAFCISRTGGGEVLGTPTDTRSNSYSQIFTTGVSWGPGVVKAWIATGSTAGADTVTFTISPSGYFACVSAEIGTVSSAVFDQSASAVIGGNISAFDSTATSSTTKANELIFGFGGSEDQSGTFTVGSGYTIDKQITQSAGAGWQSFVLEHKSVSSTGTYNATTTSSYTTSSGVMCVITLSELPIAGGMPPAVF